MTTPVEPASAELIAEIEGVETLAAGSAPTDHIIVVAGVLAYVFASLRAAEARAVEADALVQAMEYSDGDAVHWRGLCDYAVARAHTAEAENERLRTPFGVSITEITASPAWSDPMMDHLTARASTAETALAAAQDEIERMREAETWPEPKATAIAASIAEDAMGNDHLAHLLDEQQADEVRGSIQSIAYAHVAALLASLRAAEAENKRLCVVLERDADTLLNADVRAAAATTRTLTAEAEIERKDDIISEMEFGDGGIRVWELLCKEARARALTAETALAAAQAEIERLREEAEARDGFVEFVCRWTWNKPRDGTYIKDRFDIIKHHPTLLAYRDGRDGRAVTTEGGK